MNEKRIWDWKYFYSPTDNRHQSLKRQNTPGGTMKTVALGGVQDIMARSLADEGKLTIIAFSDYCPSSVISANKDVNPALLEAVKKARFSGNSRCMHFFTRPEGPFMVSKIKPQRAQRITESCYFYLSPPLCHSVSTVVFRSFISKISKVSGILVTATRDTKDPKALLAFDPKGTHAGNLTDWDKTEMPCGFMATVEWWNEAKVQS